MGQLGDTFAPRYLVQRELRAGGVGPVFLARDAAGLERHLEDGPLPRRAVRMSQRCE